VEQLWEDMLGCQMAHIKLEMSLEMEKNLEQKSLDTP
jgi:hypothetical protein